MEVLERHTKHILPGKQAERVALAKEIHAVETKYGFPPVKRFMTFAGAGSAGAEVMERQWPSLAAMETALGQAVSDPVWRALNEKLSKLMSGETQIELLWVANWA